MPTGYTALIENGKITNAKDFIMVCARAFGALIDMRDEPLSAPIPDEFQGSTFYAKLLEGNRAELEAYRSMSLAEAAEKAEREYKEAYGEYEKSLKRAETLLAKYNELQAEVEKWELPTDEHKKLKEFAIEQIEISKPEMKYYTPPHKVTAEEWLKIRIDVCERSVERYEEEAKKEAERNESRNKWLKDLRESLKDM